MSWILWSSTGGINMQLLPPAMENSQRAVPRFAWFLAEGDLDATTIFISSFYRNYKTEDCVGHCNLCSQYFILTSILHIF